MSARWLWLINVLRAICTFILTFMDRRAERATARCRARMLRLKDRGDCKPIFRRKPYDWE
jgi:hypothetical protein